MTRQRLRNGNSMKFSSAQLMGIRPVNSFHRREPNLFDDCLNLRLAGFGSCLRMRSQHFGYLIPYAHDWLNDNPGS